MRNISQIKKELELVNAAIEDVLSGKVSKYSISGQQVERISINDLRTHRDSLLKELAVFSSSLTNPRNVKYVRFK